MMVWQLLIGFCLGIVIGYFAWRAHALDCSGAWAAALSGGLIFGLGGLSWAVLLLAFFLSSSLLSRVFASRKATLAEKFSKGSQRDWGQVLANGGLGTILVVFSILFSKNTWSWVAYAGAMAAVNADTWATELGVLSSSLPRLITTGRPVARGTSGGISLEGSLASLAGALLVAACAVLFTHASRTAMQIPAIAISITLGGIGGSLFDSLLGATAQAIYWCSYCEKETERHPNHSCGHPTQHSRGWNWLNNDLVNFLTSIVGALIALGVWILLS